MIEIPEPIIDKIILGVAGAAGGYVNAIHKGKKLGWAVFSEVFAGIACAVYLTPVVTYIFPWAMRHEDAAAFIVGYSGLLAVEYMQDRIFNKGNLSPPSNVKNENKDDL